MSRARSKTVDSAEVKKKGIPRRLNEKIALIKEKEQAQSEAFEQAMRSILEVGRVGFCMFTCGMSLIEYNVLLISLLSLSLSFIFLSQMQQARTGGGSMPSLQAIDTSPPMTYTNVNITFLYYYYYSLSLSSLSLSPLSLSL